MQSSTAVAPIRIGVVSFLNTIPFIDGLDDLADVTLRHSVPSLLIDQLESGDAEIALCSSIDYQRSPVPLVVVPVGLLGGDGPTLTVRLYATRPIDAIERVCCDTDSHTSVALMQILLRERFGIDPEVVPYDAREHVAHDPAGVRLVDWPEAMLLIGDKVVTDSPPAVRYPHQLDLGAAWAEHTGRPFVFALWLARADADRERLELASRILDRQRRANQMRLDSIVHHRALPRRWPADLATEYLSQRIAYEFTPERRAGLELFFEKAAAHGLIPAQRPLALLDA